ncbi:molybdopterin-dependent oxidoreductase [Chloroflexota bacterium]
MKKDKDKERGEVSRRDFLVGTGAIVTGIVGAGMLAGCGGGTETVTTTKTVSVPTTVTTTKTVGDGGAVTVTDTVTTTVGAGETVTKTVPGPTVTTTVGGDGALEPWQEPETTVYKANIYDVSAFDTKHGKVIRGRPVHFDAIQPELEPFKITARGKTLNLPAGSVSAVMNLLYKKRAYSPNKILYPLKRVDWEPGGDPAKMNTQNRGKSKYKRISWDEAATLVANELTRVSDTYGIEAVAHKSFSMGERKTVVGDKGTFDDFLDYWGLKTYGAYPTQVAADTASFVAGAWGGVHVHGEQDWSGYEAGDYFRAVLDNTELFCFFGADPVAKSFWDALPLTQALIVQFMKKELEIKQVYTQPYLNKGAGVFNDKWIPIYPNTDPALLLAIAYTWINEGTYSQEYLDTHTVGFDKWKAYVMGDEDGTPKTPEWASPLCGVPEWTIKALARQWVAHVTSAGHSNQGGGTCRAPYSHEPMRMILYLLCMQEYGKPGVHNIRTTYFNRWAGFTCDPNPTVSQSAVGRLISAARSREFSAEEINIAGRERQQIPLRELDKAILDPPVGWWTRRPQNITKEYPKEGKSEVHLIWAGGNSFHSNDTNSFAKYEALKSEKIECFISQPLFMEESPQYSDIILPIACQMEVDDIKAMARNLQWGYLCLERKALEPRGEAKTDWGAILEVAKKLGIDQDIMGDYTSEEEMYQDLIKMGWEKSGWQDLVSWERLNEIGIFAQPSIPDWADNANNIMGNFYNNPGDNPLLTPTGKLEIESTFLLEHFPDDNERFPVAHYVRGGPPEEGWTHNEDRLISQRANDYPLLMCSDCPDWGHHSMHGDIPWTREISRQICFDGYSYENLMVNPETADERGIKHGDLVRVYNNRGSLLGAAYITEEIMTGVLHMPKSRGGYDHIRLPDEYINRSGSPNTICPAMISRHVRTSTAYNNYLVELEKVTGAQHEEWRANDPEAFERDYDPVYGPLTSGWIEEEGGNQ